MLKKQKFYYNNISEMKFNPSNKVYFLPKIFKFAKYFNFMNKLIKLKARKLKY